MFISESSLVSYLFLKEEQDCHMAVAGIVDVILSSACLGIFLIAEMRRCCSSDCDVRLLAEEYKCAMDCCATFGTRLCGGIGSIEPFTSLVALRLGRFYIAKQCYENCFSNDESGEKSEIGDVGG